MEEKARKEVPAGSHRGILLADYVRLNQEIIEFRQSPPITWGFDAELQWHHLRQVVLYCDRNVGAYPVIVD